MLQVLNMFKKCPKCGTEWTDRDSFLDDPDLKLIGYQVNFKALELGLLLFNHQTCRTTMSLEARNFRDMYKGPVYEKRMTGSDSCPGYCLHKSVLRPCPQECECSYVRSIIELIQKRKIPSKID